MNTLKPILVALAFAASTPFAVTARAQAMDQSRMDGMKMDNMSASMTQGEVRKVDADNNKITLRHGDIKNLDMPGMTMVFQVKDAALLDRVKSGDKVNFTAERADGSIVVTSIELAK